MTLKSWGLSMNIKDIDKAMKFFGDFTVKHRQSFLNYSDISPVNKLLIEFSLHYKKDLIPTNDNPLPMGELKKVLSKEHWIILEKFVKHGGRNVAYDSFETTLWVAINFFGEYVLEQVTRFGLSQADICDQQAIDKRLH